MRDGLKRLEDAGTARHFLERLREGVYISTPSGEILDANPAFLSLLGVRSLEELRSAKAADYLADPARREEWKALLDRHGSVTDFELKVRRRGGEIRIVLDSAWARVDPESGDVCYHGVVTDVTERRELETALEEQALRDPATGCYNRRYLAHVSRGGEAPEAPRGCVVLEVDRVKGGEPVPEDGTADPAANRLSRFLMRQSRAETAVVRTHSSEFVLLLKEADDKAVENVVERLVFAASREVLPPFSVGGVVRGESEPLSETIRRARDGQKSVETLSGTGRRPSGVYPLP